MIESNRTSDVGDMASDLEMIARDAALSQRIQYNGVSPLACDSCDNDIEEARRRLLPGVRMCASCAQLAELKGKRK